jgi:hypothetical protein
VKKVLIPDLDSYHKSHLPFLNEIFAQRYTFISGNSEHIKDVDVLLFFPIPSIDKLMPFIVRAKEMVLPIICYMDYPHIENFHDQIPKIKELSNKLFITELKEDSLSFLKTRQWLVGKKTNFIENAVLFCSQPLYEDSRGLDQFDLLENLVKSTNKTVWLKRHPRETRPIPKHLKNIINIYEKDLLEAFLDFEYWHGYNSTDYITWKKMLKK